MNIRIKVTILNYQRKGNILIRKSDENFPMNSKIKYWTLPIQSGSLVQQTRNLVFQVDHGVS